jgi:hypothetical protein
LAGRETELSTKLHVFEADIRKREAELAESFLKRQTDLEEINRRRVAEFEQREADLQQKVAEWDARQNTVVRRKLLEDIQKALESQKVFTLSKETSDKRKIIHGLCGIAMVFGVALVSVICNEARDIHRSSVVPCCAALCVFPLPDFDIDLLHQVV